MSGAALPHMNTMFARFVEASRKTQILASETFDPVRGVGMKPVTAGTDWAIPSFDFGHLNDAEVPNEVWSSAVLEELFRQGSERVGAGTFRLPYDNCVYLFKYSGMDARYQSVNLVHLSTEEAGIVVKCYVWSSGKPRQAGQWTKAPWKFTINNSIVKFLIDPSFFRQLPDDVVEEYSEIAKTCYVTVAAATILLPKAHPSTARSQYVTRVNRQRAMRGLRPLPDTVSLRFDHASLNQSSCTCGTCGARQPHDRR